MERIEPCRYRFVLIIKKSCIIRHCVSWQKDKLACRQRSAEDDPSDFLTVQESVRTHLQLASLSSSPMHISARTQCVVSRLCSPPDLNHDIVPFISSNHLAHGNLIALGKNFKTARIVQYQLRICCTKKTATLPVSFIREFSVTLPLSLPCLLCSPHAEPCEYWQSSQSAFSASQKNRLHAFSDPSHPSPQS